jgi:ankyrin repeat protein
LRVNLIEFSTKFKEQAHFDKKITGKLLREFFWSKPDGQSESMISFEQEFDSHYEEGKVVLFLDGFDEICPSYKNKISDFLKVLKDSKVQRLYVTTRPYGYLAEMEEELLTFSYTFEELTRADQLKIMTGIWRTQNLILDDEVANREANKLIDHFKRIGIDFNSPLLIKIVAKVFKDSFNSETNSIQINEEELNLAVLYDKFFKHLFHQVHIQEKKPGLHQSKDEPETEDFIDNLYTEAIILHKNMAFYALFGTVDNFKLMFENEFKNLPSEIEKIDKAKYKMGIIENIIEGKPKFVHKTFAEYFCALWLADEENWEKSSFRHFSRLHIINQEMVLRFFSCLMSKNISYAETYPIHAAIFQNHEKNLVNLLENVQKEGEKYTQKINEKDFLMQCSPLKYAVKLNYINLVEILLKAGADRKNLHKYFQSEQSSDKPSILTILRNSNTTISAETIYKIVINNCVELFKLIKQNTSNFGYVKIDIDWVLRKAINADAVDVFQYCYESEKAEIDQKTNYFRLAVIYDAINIAEYFIMKRNLNNNGRNEQGQTALHIASLFNAFKVVKFLVAQKIFEINSQDKNGQSSLHFAVSTNNLDVVKFLVAQKIFEINSQDKNGQTSLHHAVFKNKLVVVEFLVAQQNVEINSQDINGRTPLHFAVSRYNLSVVQFLVAQQNIDINSQDKNGDTPLHLAASNNNLHFVQIFVAHKNTNITPQNKRKQTPQQVAHENHATQVLQYLNNV